MRLSIITINFNNAGRTLKLLESLNSQTDKDFDIIIVDNATDEFDFNDLRLALHKSSAYVTKNWSSTKCLILSNLSLLRELTPVFT